MSTYGKPPPSQIHDASYETSRTYHDNTYPYAAPVYAPQTSTTPASTAPGYQNAPQLTTMAYPQNQVRAPYDEQAGQYLNVGSTSIPEVASFSPPSGTRDTKVHVIITSHYELMTANIPTFSLMFGQRKCLATLTKLNQQNGICTYSLIADAPQFSATAWSNSQVPLTMYMESGGEGGGDVIAKVDVGNFTFLDGGAPQDNSRKRKISAESAELMKSPAKRNTAQQLRPKEEYGASYSYTSADNTPAYPTYIQPTQPYGALVPPYTGRTSAYQGPAPQRQLNYGYQTTASTSPPTLKAQSPQVNNWNPYPASNMSRSPGIPSNHGIQGSRPSSIPASTVPANPPLIRTSTLQQTPSPATTPHGGHPNSHFNAYSLYPHKAKLEINGDLDAMAQGWSVDEFEQKRRLVHFKRSQNGSTITTTFQPVSAEDRPANSVCISCIYWEEKQQCFVTSVDTIYLLEQLVAARFTVEEKNRIRRNLEGFRPLTVSKGKSESEEFFKVIMAFPAPKPRNIEKDVKVFHWKDLNSALKKIIGKYSASPSSTLPPAPTLLTPVSSTGYATEGSSASMVYPTADNPHVAASPRSTTSTVTYGTNMPIPARVLSPHEQKSLGGPPDLRVAVPSPHEQWQGGAHHMQTPQQYTHTQQYMSYLDPQSASAGGAASTNSAQAMGYAASRTVDNSGAGSDNTSGARTLPSQSQQILRK